MAYQTDKYNCGLVALSCTTGFSYDFSHGLAVLAGRTTGGVHSPTMLEIFNELSLPVQFVPVSTFRRVGRRSWARFRLATFCDHFSTGAYYVRFSGHALAVIDGTVHELKGSRPGCLVLSAWRLEPSACAN